MKKIKNKDIKDIIIYILVFLLVVLIIVGIVLIDKNKNKIKNKNSNEEQKEISSEKALEMANSLYAESDSYVRVDEEESRYVIYRMDKETNKVTNTFYLDKKTGVISEEALTIENMMED